MLLGPRESLKRDIEDLERGPVHSARCALYGFVHEPVPQMVVPENEPSPLRVNYLKLILPNPLKV